MNRHSVILAIPTMTSYPPVSGCRDSSESGKDLAKHPILHPTHVFAGSTRADAFSAKQLLRGLEMATKNTNFSVLAELVGITDNLSRDRIEMHLLDEPGTTTLVMTTTEQLLEIFPEVGVDPGKLDFGFATALIFNGVELVDSPVYLGLLYQHSIGDIYAMNYASHLTVGGVTRSRRTSARSRPRRRKIWMAS